MLCTTELNTNRTQTATLLETANANKYDNANRYDNHKANWCTNHFIKNSLRLLDYMYPNNLGSQLGIQQAPYSNAMYDWTQ